MYALVDCNNFYVSCERIQKPTLIGKPVVVLSNNDGCVIARSDEVKRLGVPMGAVAFKFRKLFKNNQIHVFSSNFELYGDISNRVMNILTTFTPDIEVYSIDEAFLFFKGLENRDMIEFGKEIKRVVEQHTKIPISIGFAPTKVLAKVANRIAKKFPQRKGVYAIDTEEKRIKALKWLDVKDIWGVGIKYKERLYLRNIYKAFQFTELRDDYVRKEFTVIGLRLKKELEGESVLSLEELKKKKTITCSRSFRKSIQDFAKLEERIYTFSSFLGVKLRKEKLKTKLLSVFIIGDKFNDKKPYYSNSKAIKLPYATNSDIELCRFAKIILKDIYKENYSFKKAGVIAMNLIDSRHEQLLLFESENPKNDKVMKVMDLLNNRFEGKLRLANQDFLRWQMLQKQLSKRFTTNWEELLIVK